MFVINLDDMENSLFCDHFSNSSPPKNIFLSDLTLCRPCACCHNCCAFIRATALFCPENTVFRSYSPPVALTIFHPFFREDLSVLWGRNVIYTFHLVMSTPQYDLLMVILLIVTYCRKLL